LVRAVAARARVLELRLRVLLAEGLALRVELLLRAVATKGVTARDELVRVFLVERKPLRLHVRAVRPAGAGALVPREAEPAEALEDDLAARVGGALLIGVLDAEHERPAGLPGPEPVEERRADAADMEIARR